MTPDYAAGLTQRMLATLKVQARARLSPSVAESVSLQTELDRTTDGLLVELSARVLAEQEPPAKITKTALVEFEHPATWWDQWKEAHQMVRWAGWLVRWRGIRMAITSRQVRLTVDLTQYRTYPQADLPIPDMGSPVYVAITSTDWEGIR